MNLESRLLYALVDLGYVKPARAVDVTRQLIDGGADLIQVRAKNTPKTEIAALAKELHAVTHPAQVPLILNDYPDLLAEVAAEGCHIGQGDGTVESARRVAGRACIVGKSTHSIDQAIIAFNEGADYLGFGPLFATPTKPDAKPVGLTDVKTVYRTVALPIYCIGGIKLSNLPEVLEAGVERACIVSDLLQAPDITEKTRRVKALLTRRPHGQAK
ncbi:MAG TPA: thiamine phosphate synthase [Chthoniobacterales bacterium]